MPSWKKVIVSGSDTHLNNITASAGIHVEGNITGSLTSTGSFGHITTPGGIDAVGPFTFQTTAAANDTVFRTAGTSGYALILKNSDNSARMYFQTNTGVTNIIMDGNSQSNLLKLSADGLTETRGQVGSAHADGNLELYSNNGLNNLILSASMTTISGSGDTTLDVKGNIFSEGNISGSLTSTGSFGQVIAGGAVIEGSFSDGSATTISGSSTSTGSFGAVSIGTSDLTGGSRENTLRVNGTSYFDQSIRVGDRTEVGTNGQFKNLNGPVSLYSSYLGANIIEYSPGTKIRGHASRGESYSGVQFVQGDVLFTVANQLISGSLTSTASFGQLIVADTFASFGGSTLTVEAASVINQDLSSDASPTFAGLRSTGDVRVDGDLIANQLIVSSSVTHLTQSFSSGSTVFGDTADDTHIFTGSLEVSGSGMEIMAGASGSVGLTLTGNKISGSATLSASFGRLDITPQDSGNTNGVAISALNGGFSVANTQFTHTANGGNMVIGSTSGGGLLHSSGKVTIRRDTGTGLGMNNGLYFNDNPQGAAISMDTAASLLFGNNPSATNGAFERMKLTVSGALVFETGSYGVSGSLTSTGSFGRVEATTIAGNSPLILDTDINFSDGSNISGSATSTGSFGLLELAGNSVANEDLVKLNYANIGDTSNYAALSVNAQGSLLIESPANNSYLDINLYAGTNIVRIFKNNSSGNPGIRKSLHGSSDYVGISEGTRTNDKATFYLNYSGAQSRNHGLGGDIDARITSLMGQNLYIKAHNDTGSVSPNATGSIGRIGVNVHPQSASAQFHISASGNNATGSIFKVSANAADTFSVTNKKISGSFDTTGSFGQLDLLTNGHLRINQGGRGDEGSGLNNPSGITLFQSTTLSGDLSSAANLFSRIYDDNRLVLQNHYNNNGGGIELRTMAGGSQTTAIAVKGSTAETTIYKGLTVEGSTTINNDLAVTGSATITGDLTVNGTTSTINTTNLTVQDALAFFATGSAGSGSENVDAGIVVQSGSVDLSGSALYHDISDERWSVAKNIGANQTAITPLQYVTTIKVSDLPTNLNANKTYTGSVDYGKGEMVVDSEGEIYIYT